MDYLSFRKLWNPLGQVDNHFVARFCCILFEGMFLVKKKSIKTKLATLTCTNDQ